MQIAGVEGDQHMNTKPLSEWTLGEIKAECGKREKKCKGCLFDINPNKCRVMEAIRFRCPDSWDLSEPPRWTEQDREDAKMIKRLIPWANQVNRGMEGSLSLNPVTAIDRKLFPLLKPGESAMLDEIIGGAE